MKSTLVLMEKLSEAFNLEMNPEIQITDRHDNVMIEVSIKIPGVIRKGAIKLSDINKVKQCTNGDFSLSIESDLMIVIVQYELD